MPGPRNVTIDESVVVQNGQPTEPVRKELSSELVGPLDRIENVADSSLSSLKVPGTHDPIAVSPLPPGTDRVQSAAAGITKPKRADNVFSLSANPAKAVLDVGLEFERQRTARFAELKAEIQKAKLKADKLLKVQSECQKLSPDLKSHPLSEELKAALQSLRDDHRIDLVSTDTQEITTEQLISLRSTISSHLETLRTMEMQIPFMQAEKISSEIKSILDTLQKIIQMMDRLIEKTQGKAGQGR